MWHIILILYTTSVSNSQSTIRLTFLILTFDSSSLFKNLWENKKAIVILFTIKYTLYMTYFFHFYIKIFNKIGGQSWGRKRQTNCNLKSREYFSISVLYNFSLREKLIIKKFPPTRHEYVFSIEKRRNYIRLHRSPFLHISTARHLSSLLGPRHSHSATPEHAAAARLRPLHTRGLWTRWLPAWVAPRRDTGPSAAVLPPSVGPSGSGARPGCPSPAPAPAPPGPGEGAHEETTRWFCLDGRRWMVAQEEGEAPTGAWSSLLRGPPPAGGATSRWGFPALENWVDSGYMIDFSALVDWIWYRD